MEREREGKEKRGAPKRRRRERLAGTVDASALHRCDGPCGQSHALAYLTAAWVGAYCPPCLTQQLKEWCELRLKAVHGDRDAQDWYAGHQNQLATSPRPWTSSRRALNELMQLSV
jgi:hypothetical protein